MAKKKKKPAATHTPRQLGLRLPSEYIAAAKEIYDDENLNVSALIRDCFYRHLRARTTKPLPKPETVRVGGKVGGVTRKATASRDAKRKGKSCKSSRRVKSSAS